MGNFKNWIVISMMIFNFWCSDSSLQCTEIDCTGVQNATFFPNNCDCNKFVLCERGYKLELYCRSAVPYFDRCTSKCVEDEGVCNKTECNPIYTTTTFVTTPWTTFPPQK